MKCEARYEGEGENRALRGLVLQEEDDLEARWLDRCFGDQLGWDGVYGRRIVEFRGTSADHEPPFLWIPADLPRLPPEPPGAPRFQSLEEVLSWVVGQLETRRCLLGMLQ